MQGNLSAGTLRLIRTVAGSPIINALVPAKEFWDADTTEREFASAAYFGPDPGARLGGTAASPGAHVALPVSPRPLLILMLVAPTQTLSRRICAPPWPTPCCSPRSAASSGTCARYGRPARPPSLQPPRPPSLHPPRPPSLQPPRPPSLQTPLAAPALRPLLQLRLDRELLAQRQFGLYSPMDESASLLLDGQTLLNLEVLRNSLDGGAEGTLQALLNQAVSPFGTTPQPAVPQNARNTDAMGYAAWGS